MKDKVYNLDFWSLIGLIIESPTKAFRQIIFAEHKNLVFLILILVSLKYLINIRFISMISIGDFQSSVGLQISYLIVLGVTISFFLIFVYLYNLIGRLNKIYLRFKDTFALLVYSQIPLVFALIILFTLELVILGDYLFSLNPNPFVVKGIIAYLFLALEIGTIAWSFYLSYKAFRAQSQTFSFSLAAVISFVILFSFLLYICSLFVFTI
ncbi:MAG: YIP1 family protein [Candidatus Bathyarchaeota archaeon]